METANPLYQDETQLLQRLAAGSETSFAELYHHFYQRVIYFARRYVPEADAQDITAETFVQLWKKRADFRSVKEIGSFLFVATRNRCYDLLKYRKVRQDHEQELIELMDQADAGDFFLEQLRIELLQLIGAEVRKLPEKMREVFLLSFQEGLKPAQIAEKLQITVKTVSNQKLTALKLLRTAMEQQPGTASLFVLVEAYLLGNG